jgi:glutathione S-transferase
MADQTLTFYYAPQSRAGVTFWMLEELGIPYELKIMNLKAGDHKKPDYLAINPMGKVPAIRHGDTVITENAAICCYLADAFPEAGLAPAIGDPRRGTYLRWMFYSPSCIEPAVADKALQREAGIPSMLGYGSFDDVVNVAANAVSQGEYILGDMFSAADVIMGSMIRYGMMFGILPKRDEFNAYVERLNQRPALQRTDARDEEMAQAQGNAG